MAETVIIETSDFESNSLQIDIGFSVTHVETRWQIASSSTFALNTLLLDSWYVTTDLLGIAIFLEDGDWYFRVQFRDSYGVISEWSDPLLVSLEPPPTPDVTPCDISIPSFLTEALEPVPAFVGEGCGESPTLFNDGESTPPTFRPCS